MVLLPQLQESTKIQELKEITAKEQLRTMEKTEKKENADFKRHCLFCWGGKFPLYPCGFLWLA